MQEMTVYSPAALTPQQDFNSGLFNQYISYIDRSEKTTRTYLINLRQFAAWLRYSCITRPARQDIISYRDYLTAEHDAIQLDPLTVSGWAYRTDATGNRISVKCKPNTVTQYLRSVKQFFTWTAAEGLYPNIAANVHAPKVKHDTHRKDALTAADVLSIEHSIADRAAERAEAAETAEKDRAGRMQRSTEQGKRLYALYLLAVNCGLRTIELSRANIKDIETKGGKSVIYIWGKGHTEADTKKALAPEVKAAIDDYLKSRTDKPTGSSPLFVSTGNRSRGKRIAATTISTMLKRAMQEAGFDSERITAHSLRHTAGTNVQEITGDLYMTQQYMRHSNPATTEIYLHTETDKQEADIAQRLYNRYHGIDDTAADRAQLETVISALNPAQIQQLVKMAAAIK